MMKKILICAFVVVCGISMMFLQKTFAADACQYALGGSGSSVCGGGSDVKQFAKNVLNVLFWLVGAGAVMMIVYSGVIYVTSSGDPGKVTQAKNILLYSVIGLIVALLASTIINFVLGLL